MDHTGGLHSAEGEETPTAGSYAIRSIAWNYGGLVRALASQLRKWREKEAMGL